MIRGFYNLTSGMLTETRRLDVISQNMVNGSTAGYKEDTYHHVAFEEYMVDMIGNTHSTGTMREVGDSHLKIVSSEITTDFEQGALEETELPLDFALVGDGFFAVEWEWPDSPYNTPLGEEEQAIYESMYEREVIVDEEGNETYATVSHIGYTRSGQFSLDSEGYLFLPNYGYVLDGDYNRIQLNTDKIEADRFGNIYSSETGQELGSLGIFQFEDNSTLQRDPRGTFISTEEPTVAVDGSVDVYHKYVERSNVTLIDQMTTMMLTQRAIQSCATISKIYDDILTKTTTEVGRV